MYFFLFLLLCLFVSFGYNQSAVLRGKKLEKNIIVLFKCVDSLLRSGEDRTGKVEEGPGIPLGETGSRKGAQGRGAENHTVLENDIPASDRCTLRSIWFPSSKKLLISGLQ